MKMIFEYQNEYDKLDDCPPKNYDAKDITKVFRWVFEDINDERNFKTQYHKNPKRFQVKSDLEVCKSLALSMFEDKKGAQERFEELCEDLGDKAYQILGSHLAQGKITATCGVNSKTERLSHFNHHPTSGIPSKSTFSIIDSL